MIIIKADKSYQMMANEPLGNWTVFPDDEIYIVPNGSELARKIMTLYPHFNFIEEDGRLVDVAAYECDEILNSNEKE